MLLLALAQRAENMPPSSLMQLVNLSSSWLVAGGLRSQDVVLSMELLDLAASIPPV